MKLGSVFDGRSFDPDSGIYLVRSGNTVIYIGKNTQITNRIRHGHENRNTPLWQAIQDNRPASLDWDVEVMVVESEDPELLQYRTRAVEAELIRKHEPYLNTAYNPAAWAERT